MINNISNQKLGVLYACITAFLWGFLAIALKIAVIDVDPITVSWFRFATAAIGMFIIISFTNRQELKVLKRPPLLMFIGAIGLSINYISYISGIKLTSSINTQIIIQSAPLILGVVGIVFFKEKIKIKQGIGFLIALIGFYFFYQIKSSGTLPTNSTSYLKGSLYVFVGGLCWVAYAVCQKILVRTYSIQIINLFLFGFATIVLLPFIDFHNIFNLSIGMWLLMLFLGLNTLLAYGALGMAFKLADANKVGMIITLNPLITIITMAVLSALHVTWVSHELLTLEALAAAVAVIAGAIIVVTSK